MDCREAESLVGAYINRTLTMEQLDEFLKHVEQCSSCYDELETYYTVYFAMQHLESNEDEGTFNMQKMLRDDIRRRKLRVRTWHIRRNLFLFLLLAATGFLLVELGMMMGVF